MCINKGQQCVIRWQDYNSWGFTSVDDPDIDNKSFLPTNTFLLTSLLSGLSIRYELTDFSDQYGNIWESLDADDNSLTSEVRVIGACIQLLTSGSKIIRRSKPYIQLANEATTLLKAQKSKGIVKNSNTVQVLEVCQSLMKDKIWTHSLSQ